MACMEHTCIECGDVALDNNPWPPQWCAKCGGREFVSSCDEDPDQFTEDTDEVDE